MKGIIFRDRPLQPNEQYHHYCEICGQDIHPDFAQSHKCNPLMDIIEDDKQGTGRGRWAS